MAAVRVVFYSYFIHYFGLKRWNAFIVINVAFIEFDCSIFPPDLLFLLLWFYLLNLALGSRMAPKPADYLRRGFHYRYHVEEGIRPPNLCRDVLKLPEPSDDNLYCLYHGFSGPCVDSILDPGDNSILEPDPSYIRQPPLQLIICVQASGIYLTFLKVTEFFLDLPFHGAYDIGIIRDNLFWLQCSSERDYMFILSKSSRDFLSGSLVFSKWLPDFYPNQCPLMPIRFVLSNLPPEQGSMDAEFSIPKNIGRVLQVDFGIDYSVQSTDIFLVAEADVSVPINKHIWFYGVQWENFFVHVHAVTWFDFCHTCNEVGHEESSCHTAQLIFVSSDDSDGS